MSMQKTGRISSCNTVSSGVSCSGGQAVVCLCVWNRKWHSFKIIIKPKHNYNKSHRRRHMMSKKIWVGLLLKQFFFYQTPNNTPHKNKLVIKITFELLCLLSKALFWNQPKEAHLLVCQLSQLIIAFLTITLHFYSY